MNTNDTTYLELECLTDVAVSATAASVGGHDVLPFVPGSALLGAAARTLYRKLLDEDRALCWRVFHSGAVRFGPAYPAGPTGAPAYPVPLSLHHPKDRAPDERVDPETVYNLAAAEAEFHPRLKQLRDRHVDAHGHLVLPAVRESLRTAVEPGSGRARHGLLHELNGIAAGTRLIARLDTDDPDLLERVLEALTAPEALLLGRSRHAEFGRVKPRRLEATPDEPAPDRAPPEREAVFWCLSDLAWRDPDTGQPAFVPPASALGLPDDWRLAAERSFLRTRCYSPFNAHRRRPDLERQVVQAGSVLVYTGSTACDPGRVRTAIARAVGLYRQDGLGRLAYAPECLRDASPRFAPAPHSPRKPSSPPAEEPGSPLVQWLQRERDREMLETKAWELAGVWRSELLAEPAWAGLAPSQWLELARRVRREPARQIETIVRTFTTKSMRKLPDRWGAKRGRDGQTLADWLLEMVREAIKHKNGGPELAALAVRVLAHLAARATRQKPSSQRQPEEVTA